MQVSISLVTQILCCIRHCYDTGILSSLNVWDDFKIKYFSFYRFYSQATHQQHIKISDPHTFVKSELADLNNSILNVGIWKTKEM